MSAEMNHTDLLSQIKDLHIGLLVKNLNGLERTFGNYIFEKYIKPKINLDGLLQKEQEQKIKETKLNFDKEYYSIKPQTITQEQQLKVELKDIKRANEEYEKNPLYKEKITKTVFGYPDRFRCEFIILGKHKLHRCKSKVFRDKEIETDEDLTKAEIIDEQCLYVCKKHLHMENKYAKEYQKLIEKINLD